MASDPPQFMSTKVPTTQLKVGMFVADLDRPWADTPFPLQGFLIENDRQIAELHRLCKHVVIDRARSTGKEYAAAPTIDVTATNRSLNRAVVQQAKAAAAAAVTATATVERVDPARPGAPRGGRMKLEDAIASARVITYEGTASEPDDEGEASGFFGRFVGFFRGGSRPRRGGGGPAAPPPKFEAPRETKAEFEARAALLPPGIPAQTYRDQVSVEQEVPHARAAVAEASGLLDKLVEDIRIGQKFEVERVEEIVKDMVESIVRNPDALMWVARLREQDATTYGHGLQVSVYLTSFGRHLGFPKQQLEMLAQIGLLLDIGKIRLPRELLEKQGRFTDDEFDIAKKHVDHSLAILQETPNFDPQILQAIGQHHERLNGSGYPEALQGDEISIYGQMAGITDCFAALIKRRPYADAVSSYEALRSLTSWGGELFQEALVQQFVSSVGVFRSEEH